MYVCMYDHLWLIIYTDTSGGSSANATAPVVDRFGWTTLIAITATKQTSHTVRMEDGADTAVNTVTMSQSDA